MTDEEKKGIDWLMVGYILWLPGLIALYFLVQWVGSW